MRLSGGTARGIPLKSPPGDEIRPATDAMRQAVFNSLGDLVKDATVVDIFAGTGSYGLEALSRGAAHVLFIEKDRRCKKLIETNLAAVGKALALNPAETRTRASITIADFFTWHKRMPHHTAELVFVDPPYPLLREDTDRMLAALATLLDAQVHTRLVLEAPGDLALPEEAYGLSLVKRLGKGPHQPCAFIYRPSENYE